MPRQWTEEQKRKQAEAIRRWKPWEKSTGPRTKRGKNKCRLNAARHGFCSQGYRELCAALREQARFIREARKRVLDIALADAGIDLRVAQGFPRPPAGADQLHGGVKSVPGAKAGGSFRPDRMVTAPLPHAGHNPLKKQGLPSHNLLRTPM